MKKKIFIVCHAIYDQGGISTSLLNLLNIFHDQYDLTICPSEGYISPNVVLPRNIQIIKGSSFIGDAVINRSLLSKQSFMKRMRRLIIRFIRHFKGMNFIIRRGLSHIEIPPIVYDVAIAFSNDIYSNREISEGGDYDLVIHKVNAKRKVAWMHNDLRKEGYDHNICLKVFRDFDAIVNVSMDNKDLFDSITPEYIEKSYVVYNTYNFDQIITLAQEENPYENDGKMHFVTVARVGIKQKRIDRIIEACKKLKENSFVEFTWTIVGDGGDRESLEKLSVEYGITNLVKFVGLKTNPYPYMFYADAFVLSSLYEGLPMTLMEAKILCCPILITNFGSAHEALKDGFEGVVCENSTQGLYKMIKTVLENPNVLNFYRHYLKDHPITNDVAINQFKEVCGL